MTHRAMPGWVKHLPLRGTVIALLYVNHMLELGFGALFGCYA
jgi:hypothetical protein